MIIQRPSYTVPEGEGFTDEQDIFRRKEFGYSLRSLIENVDGELVIALDANWGEGKSTFIQMWRNEMSHELPVVVYDAFANDQSGSAFLSIASEIYAIADQENAQAKPDVLRRAQAVAKTVLRSSLKIGLRMATAGALDDTTFADLEVDGDIGDAISEGADRMIEERISSAKADRKCIQAFKNSLEGMAGEISESGKLVFVVDELDRCRPDYALEVLEVIKHFFSVPGVVFILSVNRSQLEAAIRHRYGSDVDSNQYLQKFVGLWVGLPDGDLGRLSRREKYISRVLADMEFDESFKGSDVVKRSLSDMAQHYKMTLREIERLLTIFAVFFNATGPRKHTELYELGVVICAIKAKFPMVFKQIAEDVTFYGDILQQAELESLKSDSWGDRVEGHRLKYILKLYLMPDDRKYEYIQEHKYVRMEGYLQRDAVAATCRVIESFGRYI